MSENRHNAESKPAEPVEEVAIDPDAPAEPVSVGNSFNSNPDRQQSWLSYLRANDRGVEADQLEAELQGGK